MRSDFYPVRAVFVHPDGRRSSASVYYNWSDRHVYNVVAEELDRTGRRASLHRASDPFLGECAIFNPPDNDGEYWVSVADIDECDRSIPCKCGTLLDESDAAVSEVIPPDPEVGLKMARFVFGDVTCPKCGRIVEAEDIPHNMYDLWQDRKLGL